MVVRGDATPVVGAAYDIGPVRATAHYRDDHSVFGHDQGAQWSAGLQGVHRWRAMEFGMGAAYLSRSDDLNGSRPNFSLSAGLVRGRWSLTLRHYSNAGLKRPNYGSDFLVIGYRF